MKHLTVFTVCIFLLSCACNPTDEITETSISNCDQKAIVDQALFNDAPADAFRFNKVVLTDECLELVLTASGCSGSNWAMEFIDSGEVAESFPVQRSVRLSLSNSELCQAIIEQTLSFDLTALQVEGNDVVLLNLEGWDEQLRYEY